MCIRDSSYIDIIIKFELGFGFAFELPLIVFYLVIFDVIPYKKLRGSWRTVYVAVSYTHLDVYKRQGENRLFGPQRAYGGLYRRGRLRAFRRTGGNHSRACGYLHFG